MSTQTAMGPLTGLGALASGKQTSELLNQQADIQRRNAAEAILKAKFDADRQGMIAGKHMGTMTSQFGASGVEMGSGSVIDVMAESAANSEMDRLNILHGGDLRATNAENQARLDELGAKHAISASYFNALSDVVGAASKGYEPSSEKAGGDPYATDYEAGNSLGYSGEEEMGATGGASEVEAAAAIA